MSGLFRLVCILSLVLLQVGHSVEQGSRSILQQPYRGQILNQGNPHEGLQQQVIVPGGFQHHLIQGNFPALRTIDTRNSRVIPSIQNGHFQLRNPSLTPSLETQAGRNRGFTPILTGSTAGQRPLTSGSQTSGSGQDLRAGETQYEYYDDADSDIVYHYSNEDGAEGAGGSQEPSSSAGAGGLPSVSKSIVPNEAKRLQQGRLNQQASQTSSFIPLVEDEEPLGHGLAYKGRSVHPQPSLRNSAFVASPNPTPLPGLLRNASIITKNRSTPPVPAPPVPPTVTRRPGVLKGPVNRFTLTSRPPYTHASASPGVIRTLPSSHLAKSNEQQIIIRGSGNSGNVKAAPAADEEYVEEYHDEEGETYYEGGEEENPGRKSEVGVDKSSKETKTKVTVSVSTKTSSTTTAPPVVLKPKATPAPGIVISVATTRSISDKRNKGFGSTPPPPTTPKVTFSRATGSSIVVASVQTSRSVATPSSSSQRLISSQHPPQDSSKPDTEYTYDEEYTYPENYPVQSGSPLEVKASESSLISPSPGEDVSALDKLERVQSDLVNGVLQASHNNNPSTPTPISSTAANKELGVVISTNNDNVEKQKKSLNFIASENDRSNEEVKSLTVDSLFKNIKFKDLSGLLPNGYRDSSPVAVATPTSTTTTTTEVSTTTTATTAKPEPSSTLNSLLASIKFEEANLSSLLPKGYKPTFASSSNKGVISSSSSTSTTSTPSPTSSTTTTAGRVNSESGGGTEKPKISSIDSLLTKVKFSDISALLPPGYDESRFSSSSSSTTSPVPTTTTSQQPKTGLDALVSSISFDDISKFLPPGYKPPSDQQTTESPASSTTSSSTTTTSAGEGTTTAKSLNKLVFPTRPGGLKFTRPVTTEAPKGDTPPPPKVTIQNGWPQRKTTEFTGWPSTSTLPTVVSTTTTESTTSTTTTTTTTERPTTTTLPPKRSSPTTCTEPFCKMEAVLRIVGFRWKPEYGDINTEEWKHLERTVKRELDAAYRSSGLAQYYRSVEIEGFTRGSIIVDYFVILENVTTNLTSADVRALFHGSLPPSDQHDFSSDNAEVDKVGIAADERLRLGRYVIDPKYTDFKVRNYTNEIHGASASEGIIPQWGIAVIVIGLASLMFVVIFGVTVLVNRHKNSKKKNAVSLTQEMLSEFNKTHSYGHDNYGADDLYNMDDVWNDKQPHMDRTFDRKPGKRASSSGKGSANYNIYDSWKTEWNGYYYNGNYYGDSGYAPSRRRSDYDTNF